MEQGSAWRGGARLGAARCGWTWQGARQGKAWLGLARRGKELGSAGRGLARRGLAGQGMDQGKAWQGKDQGGAWPGLAGYGSDHGQSFILANRVCIFYTLRRRVCLHMASLHAS